MVPSVNKGRHGFDGQKYAHIASIPLTIQQVFSSGLSLSVPAFGAPAKLPCTCQQWIFEWFLFFEVQAGWRPSRRKGQKAPKRHAVRRVWPCQPMVVSVHKNNRNFRFRQLAQLASNRSKRKIVSFLRVSRKSFCVLREIKQKNYWFLTKKLFIFLHTRHIIVLNG